MTYLEAKEIARALNADVGFLSRALQVFPTGPMGLISDATRATREFRDAKAAYDVAFAHLRSFNGRFMKAFAKEIRMERKCAARNRRNAQCHT